MSHVCLMCTTPGLNANNCCGHPRRPVKEWSDYSGNNLVSLKKYNPSCRRIAFDVHVDVAHNAVYVVVRVTLAYEDGGTGTPWTAPRKTSFARMMKAAVGLWDAGVTFTHYQAGGVANQYTPRFFVHIVGGLFPDAHMTVTAVSSAAPQRLGVQGPGALGELMLAPGLVVLRGPYDNLRPKPGSGTSHAVGVRLNEFAPHSFEFDNLVLPRANRRIVNTVAHEYGHMIGLPDEYDAYPPAFSTAQLGGGRVVRGMLNTDKDKTVAFWVELLGENRMVSPAWGHGVPEESIMRTVDTRAGAFRDRHYVTILEALNLLAKKNLGNLGGVWSF